MTALPRVRPLTATPPATLLRRAGHIRCAAAVTSAAPPATSATRLATPLRRLVTAVTPPATAGADGATGADGPVRPADVPAGPRPDAPPAAPQLPVVQRTAEEARPDPPRPLVADDPVRPLVARPAPGRVDAACRRRRPPPQPPPVQPLSLTSGTTLRRPPRGGQATGVGAPLPSIPATAVLPSGAPVPRPPVTPATSVTSVSSASPVTRQSGQLGQPGRRPPASCRLSPVSPQPGSRSPQSPRSRRRSPPGPGFRAAGRPPSRPLPRLPAHCPPPHAGGATGRGLPAPCRPGPARCRRPGRASRAGRGAAGADPAAAAGQTARSAPPTHPLRTAGRSRLTVRCGAARLTTTTAIPSVRPVSHPPGPNGRGMRPGRDGARPARPRCRSPGYAQTRRPPRRACPPRRRRLCSARSRSAPWSRGRRRRPVGQPPRRHRPK